jgi:hypothetical protein
MFVQKEYKEIFHMPETGVTINEHEAKYQQGSTSSPKQPSVQEFKEIVMRHCRGWDVSNVDGLCTSQTQTLIEELAQYFH